MPVMPSSLPDTMRAQAFLEGIRGKRLAYRRTDGPHYV